MRSRFSDYEAQLAAAKEEKETALRERREAEPRGKRRKRVEKAARAAEAAKRKLAEEVDSLTAQQLSLQEQLEAKRLELETAEQNCRDTKAKVDAIRAEAASTEATAPKVDEALAAADGLAKQLEALPLAVAAGNPDVAMAAIRQQLQMVLDHIGTPYRYAS